MSNLPKVVDPSRQPVTTTYLVVHRNWYALDGRGDLMTGPVLPDGSPSFSEGCHIELWGVDSEESAQGVQEIWYMLRALRSSRIDTILPR